MACCIYTPALMSRHLVDFEKWLIESNQPEWCEGSTSRMSQKRALLSIFNLFSAKCIKLTLEWLNRSFSTCHNVQWPLTKHLFRVWDRLKNNRFQTKFLEKKCIRKFEVNVSRENHMISEFYRNFVWFELFQFVWKNEPIFRSTLFSITTQCKIAHCNMFRIDIENFQYLMVKDQSCVDVETVWFPEMSKLFTTFQHISEFPI